MGTLPRDGWSPRVPGGDADGRGREQQRRLRRFLETKERARPPPAEPLPDAWVPPDAPSDPPEVVGEGQEEPPEEEEAPPRGLSRVLLVTQQQRQLQRLQQRRDQLQGALSAAAASGEPGGDPGGDPELMELEGETRELQDRARRGRSLLGLLGDGVAQLLAQLDEHADLDLDPDPDLDPDLDPDPLLAQLRHLEAAVTRLLGRGGGAPQVPAGDEEAAAAPTPPPLRPPSPREEPPGGAQDEVRPLSRGELRDRVRREVLNREGCAPPQ
ncbi:uncharacterized protein [Patagioenas fasciata]|uniref:uncharacterized protein n=1 Tax=Patagioenas fasciata TaxID=372321 RepID=UPI003A9A22A2